MAASDYITDPKLRAAAQRAEAAAAGAPVAGRSALITDAPADPNASLLEPVVSAPVAGAVPGAQAEAAALQRPGVTVLPEGTVVRAGSDPAVVAAAEEERRQALLRSRGVSVPGQAGPAGQAAPSGAPATVRPMSAGVGRPVYATTGTDTFRPTSRQVQLGPELAPVQRERDEAVSYSELPTEALYQDLGVSALRGAKSLARDASGKARISAAELRGLVSPADYATLTAGAVADRKKTILVDPVQLARSAGSQAHVRALAGEEVQGTSGSYRYQDGQLRRRWTEQVSEQQIRGELQQQESEYQAKLADEASRQELQEDLSRQRLLDEDATTQDEVAARAAERERVLGEKAATVEKAYDEFTRLGAPKPSITLGQQIAAVIVGALGGVNGDPEAGVRLVNQALDRDLVRQQSAIDKARDNAQVAESAYASAKQQFADRDAAYAAARSAMRERVVAEIDNALWKFQGNQRALERGYALKTALQRQQQEERLAWAEKYGPRIVQAEQFDPRRTVQVGTAGGPSLRQVSEMIERTSATPEEKAAKWQEFYTTGQASVKGGGTAMSADSRKAAEDGLRSVKAERSLVEENARLAAKAAHEGLTDTEYLTMQSNSAKLFVVPGPGGSSRYGKSDEDRAAFNREISILPPAPTVWSQARAFFNVNPDANPQAVAEHWSNMVVKLQQEENQLRQELGK